MCEPTQVEQIPPQYRHHRFEFEVFTHFVCRRHHRAARGHSGRRGRTVLDCAGGMIVAPEAEPYSLLIQSRRNSDGSWSAPRHVQVKNCTVVGGTRIVGLGINGQAEAVRQSSLTAGHTERAQTAAPVDTQFDNVVFQGAVPSRCTSRRA